MIKISEAELNTLNQNFRKFQTRIIQSKKQDNTYFISQLGKFEKQYKKAGLERSFAGNIFDFAEKLRSMGIEDLPGIIYSALVKMPFIKPHVKEVYARKGLEFAEEQGDYIHILSRLVDLEKLYKQTKDSHNYARTLFQEEKVLIAICNDYANAKKNFKTYNRENSPLKKYEIELAKTRVDIAKVILKTNPNQARIVLEKARKIFKREERQKEVDFINLMLSEIKEI